MPSKKLTAPQQEFLLLIYGSTGPRYAVDRYPPLKALLHEELIQPAEGLEDYYVITAKGREVAAKLPPATPGRARQTVKRGDSR